MSAPRKSKTNKKNMNQSQQVIQCVEPDTIESSGDDSIEVSKKKVKKVKVIEVEEEPVVPVVPVKKVVSQSKIDGMAHARETRLANLKNKRNNDEKARELIEKSYHAEIEANLIKSTLPKYSRQIKKDILEKLKQKKLEELKKQYGYDSNASSSSSDSEEEEIVLTRKNTKPMKESKKRPVTPPAPKSLLQRFQDYGF